MLVKQERENFWILNWLDEFMTGHKGFICGGCFKNIFNHEKVKDLDIFFNSKSDWEDAVNYFDSKTKGYVDIEQYDDETGLSEEDAEYTFYYKNDNVRLPRRAIARRIRRSLSICTSRPQRSTIPPIALIIFLRHFTVNMI